jgi:hypothetical protein
MRTQTRVDQDVLHLAVEDGAGVGQVGRRRKDWRELGGEDTRGCRSGVATASKRQLSGSRALGSTRRTHLPARPSGSVQ